MRIAGVASAFPKYYYKQQVLVDALKNYWRTSCRSRAFSTAWMKA